MKPWNLEHCMWGGVTWCVLFLLHWNNGNKETEESISLEGAPWSPFWIAATRRRTRKFMEKSFRRRSHKKRVRSLCFQPDCLKETSRPKVEEETDLPASLWLHLDYCAVHCRHYCISNDFSCFQEPPVHGCASSFILYYQSDEVRFPCGSPLPASCWTRLHRSVCGSKSTS